jgi:hypothetical protein
MNDTPRTQARPKLRGRAAAPRSAARWPPAVMALRSQERRRIGWRPPPGGLL